ARRGSSTRPAGPSRRTPPPLGAGSAAGARSVPRARSRDADSVAEQLGCHRPAEEPAPPRERDRLARAFGAAALGEAQALEPRERFPVERAVQAADGEGLVEPEPEQHALAVTYLSLERLELARRLVPPPQRRDVRVELRRVP